MTVQLRIRSCETGRRGTHPCASTCGRHDAAPEGYKLSPAKGLWRQRWERCVLRCLSELAGGGCRTAAFLSFESALEAKSSTVRLSLSGQLAKSGGARDDALPGVAPVRARRSRMGHRHQRASHSRCGSHHGCWNRRSHRSRDDGWSAWSHAIPSCPSAWLFATDSEKNEEPDVPFVRRAQGRFFANGWPPCPFAPLSVKVLAGGANFAERARPRAQQPRRLQSCWRFPAPCPFPRFCARGRAHSVGWRLRCAAFIRG